MRPDRIIDNISKTEIFYSCKKTEAIITGLERPINEHLLKLPAAPADAPTTGHCHAELQNWFEEIAEIRLKPSHRPADAHSYFRILFDEPFGGIESANIEGCLRRIIRGGQPVRLSADLDKAANALRDFHTVFAATCAAGQAREDSIRAQLEALTARAKDIAPPPG